MPPELFLDLYSPPCRAIYIFALKNGIPFQLRPVELGRGEHLKPEFLKVNPLGKVPALRDGDFLLAESVAILLYLSRKYQTAEHWYPPELQARARVDEYLAWQHTAVQLPATNVYLCKSLLPHFSGQPVDQERLDRLMGKLRPALQHLDQEVLAAKPFLATEQVSLADLMAFTELMQPTAVGCDLFRDWPRLAAWRARVEAALGPELVQEAHKLVLQPRDPRDAQRGDMKILLLCLALVLASDAQLLLPNVLTQVSGPWKTLYVSSNNLDKIAENGPFRIYIRRINVDIPRLKILFSFFVKVDGECVEKSVEASIGQDNLINAHYAGGNYHQILDVTPNALIGYIVNVDDKGRITKLASLVGRGAHVNEEDIAKFKKLSREKGIPEENIIYLGDTDNCPNHE